MQGLKALKKKKKEWGNLWWGAVQRFTEEKVMPKSLMCLFEKILRILDIEKATHRAP